MFLGHFLLLVLCLFPSHHLAKFHPQPVVLFPGIGGAELEAKLTHATPPSDFCKKDSDWYTIWVNLSEDIRWLHVSCFQYILRVFWDNVTFPHLSHNSPGVQIRAKDFGGMGGLYCVDETFCHLTRYFSDLIDLLEKTYGYEIGKNLLGAPFDFRLGWADLALDGGYFSQVKSLVEKAFIDNGNEKVHLLGHSQGVTALSYFVSTFVTSEWKEKYIASFISIAGVWDGANEAYAYPYAGAGELPSWLQWGLFKPLIKYEAQLFKEVSYWPGVQWLVPKVIAQDEVVVTTKSTTYKGSDYVKMLRDAGLDLQAQMYEYEARISVDLPPNVPLHCIYTDDMKTPLAFYIDDLANVTEAYVNKWGLGDGQVQNSNHFLCDGMAKRQSEPVNVLRTSNVGHDFMPRDKTVLEYVASVLVKVEEE